tara:strand:+ start:319 stop:477 length:159 start_codon:yes stop_codon:yes gene_type:complete
MKHALIWIVETFYPERVDEIFDNPRCWAELFELHEDSYLESADFKAREALRK